MTSSGSITLHFEVKIIQGEDNQWGNAKEKRRKRKDQRKIVEKKGKIYVRVKVENIKRTQECEEQIP
jgi:hypothetical protein